MRAAVSTRAVRGTLCALLCAIAVSSCRELEGPDTQVMLRIHCEDRPLIAAMTGLSLSFALEEDEPWGWQSHAKTEYAKGTLSWPVDIPIVPSDLDDERKRFEVVVEAMDGQRVLAQQRALTGFVAGGLRLLEVWLYTCPREAALSCLEPGCQHDGCRVCQLDGECGSSVIAPERLPKFEVEQDPISRPPFDTTGAPSGAMAPGGSSAGATPQAGTGASAGIASPSGGASATGAPGMPGGTGSDAGAPAPGGAITTGGGGGATSGAGAANDAGGIIITTVVDAAVRDAGAAMTGGTTGGASGIDAGVRDAGTPDTGTPDAGPRDAGVDAALDAAPSEASVPEAGNLGGMAGNGSISGLGGLFGGASGTTTSFSFDESGFGPGSYSGE